MCYILREFFKKKKNFCKKSEIKLFYFDMLQQIQKILQKSKKNCIKSVKKTLQAPLNCVQGICEVQENMFSWIDKLSNFAF